VSIKGLGLRVVAATVAWTNLALKVPMFAKGASLCSQPSHHEHPAAFS